MEPFLGEIMMVGFNFAPRGWLTCDGQLLPINQNSALFSLLGTFYGGDGRTTFGIPEMRGRSALHVGTGPGLSPITVGQNGGSNTHSLSINELPAHNHNVNLGGAVGTTAVGTDNFLAFNSSADTIYTSAGVSGNLNTGSISNTGGGLPINIQNPYIGITHVIATTGLFPSRN